MSFLYLGFCHYVSHHSQQLKTGKRFCYISLQQFVLQTTLQLQFLQGGRRALCLGTEIPEPNMLGSNPFQEQCNLGRLRNFPVRSLSYLQNGDNSVCLVLLWSAAAATKSLQSCPTLCDPIDGSPPGSPVPGILQARTLFRPRLIPTSFQQSFFFFFL